jgi:hypothetical protein
VDLHVLRPRDAGAPAALLAVVAAGLAAPLPAADEVPAPVLAFAQRLPAIFEGLEGVVAREEMRQETMDPLAARPLRRRLLVSDYQIAPLEEDPGSLWEFRFVREVDGKPVEGSERQLEDFLRLRHRDAREERTRIVELARARSLEGCYWHNLTLVIVAFSEPYLGNYRWRGSGERYDFEQVRGPGIPEDLFDPRSPRHYPTGSIAFAGPARELSRIDLRFPARDTYVEMRLSFSSSALAGVPLPAEYVIERKRAGTTRTLMRTTLAYSNYRRFTVTSEGVAAEPR